MEKHPDQIERQLEEVEQRIREFESHVNIEELSPIKCMEFAMKLRAQYLTLLRLKKGSEAEVSDDGASRKSLRSEVDGGEETMDAFMKSLRGEFDGDDDLIADLDDLMDDLLA
jgi:hypothetical protein